MLVKFPGYQKSWFNVNNLLGTWVLTHILAAIDDSGAKLGALFTVKAKST